MTNQQLLTLSRVFEDVEESQERKDQALAPFRPAAFAKSGSARKTHQGTSRLPNAAALKVAYAKMASLDAARAHPGSRSGTFSPRQAQEARQSYRSGIHTVTKAASSITGFPNRPTPAMGIPDRQDYGDPASLSEGDLVDYFIQRHEARRAGCFAKGTPIKMANGDFKPIESLQPGDLIASGETKSRVTKLWQNGVALDWIDVDNGSCGLLVTPNHHFKVDEVGWIPIGWLLGVPASVDNYGHIKVESDKALSNLQQRVSRCTAHLQPELCDSFGAYPQRPAKTYSHSETPTVCARFRAAHAQPTEKMAYAGGSNLANPEVLRRGTDPAGDGGDDWLFARVGNGCNDTPENTVSRRAIGTLSRTGNWIKQLELERRNLQQESGGLRGRRAYTREATPTNYSGVGQSTLRMVPQDGCEAVSAPHYTLSFFKGSFSRKHGTAVLALPQQSRSQISGTGRTSVSIRRLPRIARSRYDIEVENTHCYFAGPYLVHNSHYDLRMGTPERNLYSWATKKEIPEPGGRIAVYQQPVHCFPPNTLVITDQGNVTIGDIVNKRLPVKVMSLNREGQLEWRPVVQYWKTPNKGDLLVLRTSAAFNGRGFLVTTPGHVVYTPTGKRQVGDLLPGDAVLQYQPLLTDGQLQILLGGLLGDASIAENGVWRTGHTESQVAYLNWKRESLAPFISTGYTRPAGSGYGKNRFHAITSVQNYAPLMELRRDWYDNGIKHVPLKWLEKLDARGLAVWYQDDGSRLVAKGRFIGCSLATHGFSEIAVQNLVNWLQERWHFKSARKVKRGRNNAGSQKYEIRLSPTDAINFWTIILPYMHPVLAYKCDPPNAWRTARCHYCHELMELPGTGHAVRRFKYCDACLLADLKRLNIYTEAAYEKAYAAKLTKFAPRSYRVRFGKFPDAQTCPFRYTRPSLPAVGGLLSMFSCPPQFGLLPAQIIKVSPAGPKGRYRTSQTRYVYDIGVEVNHNYLINSGYLVSNSYAYGPFEGILGPGYGHGTVKQHRKGKLQITKSGPDGIHFTTADETPRRFVLVPPRKSGDRRWLLVAAKDVPKVPKVPNQEQNI